MKVVYDENGREGLELNVLDCVMLGLFFAALFILLAFSTAAPFLWP
jgi:hypothetical protein